MKSDGAGRGGGIGIDSVDLLYSCIDAESPWSSFLDALARDLHASVVGIATNSTLQSVVGVDAAELVQISSALRTD